MTSTSHCFDNHDLNPETCTFVKKCPPGKVRNDNFRCVKVKDPADNVVRKKVEKRKSDAEKRLRDRADILRSRTDTFFRNGNSAQNSNSKIKDALMRLRRQTIKRDVSDVTKNLTDMIDRINEFRKSKKTTKPRSSRRKKTETVDLKEFNSFNEDLRLSNSSKSSKSSPEASQEEVDLNAEERTRLISPNSPSKETDENKIKEYASQISKMANMLNFSKLKAPRRPRQTLKSRKIAESKPRKKGTSLNGPTTKPKASRRKITHQNDISL